MPRLLIQCQGSPGPLSFKLTQDKADAVVHHYNNYSQRHVIPLKNDKGDFYCIDMALVSWICVIDENEPESEPDLIYTPTGTGPSQEALDTIENVIQDVRDDITNRL